MCLHRGACQAACCSSMLARFCPVRERHPHCASTAAHCLCIKPLPPPARLPPAMMWCAWCGSGTRPSCCPSSWCRPTAGRSTLWRACRCAGGVPYLAGPVQRCLGSLAAFCVWGSGRHPCVANSREEHVVEGLQVRGVGCAISRLGLMFRVSELESTRSTRWGGHLLPAGLRGACHLLRAGVSRPSRV